MSRVLVLIATIPPRKKSCERLLAELTRQTRQPDGVVLVLDGYGEAPAPTCSLPVIASRRTAHMQGAGARWGVAADLLSDDILICLDDDIVVAQAPNLVKSLVATIETNDGAAAAIGRGIDNKAAPPGPHSRGQLIYAAGCGLAVRAKHLIGLEEFGLWVISAGGPDTLGRLGDDDALVSAYLWKNGVTIKHAATGNIYAAPGMKTTSQTAAKKVKQEKPDVQKIALQRITGWPWIKKITAPVVRR